MSTWKHTYESTSEKGDPSLDVFEHLTAYERYVDVEVALDRISDRVQKPARLHTSKIFTRIAAILVIGLGMAWFGYHFTHTGSGDSTLVAVLYPDTQEFTLPDGTKVTLAANSTLSFVEGFASGRDVTLEGQAYFDVKKDKNSPFVVHHSAGYGQVKVLGTMFELEMEQEIAVSVTEGLVELLGEGSSVKIKPGQTGTLASNGKLKVSSTNDRFLHSWRTGKFHFENSSMTTVISELEKFYQVTFEVGKGIRKCKVTASFDNESLESVTMILAAILDAQIQIVGDKVEITGAGCK